MWLIGSQIYTKKYNEILLETIYILDRGKVREIKL